MSYEDLQKIAKGDVIERMLAFTIPNYLKVSRVEKELIWCGPWCFNRRTGVEIDEDVPSTVSYIRRVLTEEQKRMLSEGVKFLPLELSLNEV